MEVKNRVTTVKKVQSPSKKQANVIALFWKIKEMKLHPKAQAGWS